MKQYRFNAAACKWIISLFLTCILTIAHAQQSGTVYHTPSGTRYHAAKCHMVDNTSNGITRTEALKRDMKPCTFCKPDENKSNLAPQSIKPVEKPGQKAEASQCIGNTQHGIRCKRPTKNANGYCFQHLPEVKA